MKTTVKKIYLDMDGVISDFHKRFVELYGPEALGFRDRKNFTVYWPDFIQKKQFEELEWFPGGQELLKFLQDKDIEIEILSSSGGHKFHSEVEEQKKNWLSKRGIDYKPNIVPGRKLKAEYATPETILIDDTEDVIESFNEAGGIGILHKDANITIKRLEDLLNT